MAKTLVITGATSGIGRASALLFSEHGWDVAITGRRKKRLQLLSEEIKDRYHTTAIPLCFDIRDVSACKQASETLCSAFDDIHLLVNNAGLAAGTQPIQQGDISNWERMIDTNIKGLLYMSKFLFPALIKSKGQIINIGSTAGKDVYKNGNVYCATKYAVDALTKSMRIDLLPHGVKVSSVCPGAAHTEFSLVRMGGDNRKAEDVYRGFTPLSAADIAEVIYFCATRPPHVNINDIVMSCTAQANSCYFYKNEP